MQFLFETYKRHHEEGIEAHKAGDYPRARMHYLLAAKYLCAMAKETDSEFKEERLKKAQRLIDIAKELEDKDPVRAKDALTGQGGKGTLRRGLGQAPAQRASADEEEEAPTDKWIVSNPPKTRFEDIAGLEEVKKLIQLRVIYPLRHPEVTKRFGKKAGGGILLYGPPGTGKTMMARAIASELGATFFCVKCSDIMSKWVGTAEKNIRQLFEAARSHPQSVIFLDETEAIVARRGGGSTVMDRVIPEFLAQVDGLEKHDGMLLLLGATNRPWDMDEAAVRPGRFDEMIYIPLPDQAARMQILQMNLKDVPLAAGIDCADFARRLEGYSGADIRGLVEAATDLPYQRQIETGVEQQLTSQDLEKAILRIRPSVTAQSLARYEQFRKARNV